MKPTSFPRFPRECPHLLTASGGMRLLGAGMVLLALWGVIHWASLLP
ncbi:hypothetical protein [Martelella alba]|nr:hypothetical protein [Martelella alba]